MSSTRWFSVTTCRTRRRVSSSTSLAERVVEPGRRHVPQGGHAEQRRGLLARGPAVRVLAVGVPMRGAAVDHQYGQPVGVQVERDVGRLFGAAVEEEGVSGPAADRRRLIHDPGGCADVAVLGPLGQPGPLLGGQVEAAEVDQRGEHGRLQRGRGGQPGAQRHVGGDGQPGARHRVTGLA